jgi:ssDNA-binding Zn-finger/Zn-ribbon topoisomerase 1
LIKALQKDREKRFQTAGEMEQALARLSPQTEGAFQPQGQEPTPGRCPKCGHQHLIIQRKAFDRKFCESCGNTLLEPCLKCKAENGVWSKFCGRCGADLAASLQTAVKQLQADREQVTSLCKASRFTEALECLMGMSLVDHPRLVEYEEWANETVPKVKADFEKAKLQRNCAIEKAKPLMKACDFAGAILALQAIAEPLQTQQSRELVLSAQVAVAEIGVLRDEIRSRMMSNQPEGVKSKVARLIELQPNDPQLPPLLQRLEAWEVRQQKDREARELRQQQQLWQAASSPPSIEGYRQYLDAYPNGIYVEQAKQALAPFLRKKLLQDLNNIGLRKDYLDKRTPSLAAMDEQMALEGSRIAYAVAAGIGGGLGGAFVGGVADWFGALLAGLVTGIAVTLFLDK